MEQFVVLMAGALGCADIGVFQGPFSLNDADVTYRLIIADRAHMDSVPDVVVTSCAAGSELLLRSVNQ